MLDVDAEQSERDLAVTRQRLGTVQGQIKNLVGVLMAVGQQGLASVQEELAGLGDEKTQLEERLDQLTQCRAPVDATTEAARQFIESWQRVADLLAEATDEEKITLVQHLVEVVELRSGEGNP